MYPSLPGSCCNREPVTAFLTVVVVVAVSGLSLYNMSKEAHRRRESALIASSRQLNGD